MRSVKLTISGEFWDSQIYSGELILFGFNGSIHYINWRGAIDRLADQNQNIQTALRVSFADSDLFYSSHVLKVLSDPCIRAQIEYQLSDLANKEFHVSEQDWGDFWKVKDSPLGFLPTDTDVYYSKLFACGDEGLYSASKNISDGAFNRGKVKKHHDARFFQIKSSHRFTTVAAAAGTDGLMEFPYIDANLGAEKIIASRDCSACDWAFQSVMGWANNTSFLVNFKQEKDARTNRTKRIFDRVIDSDHIFSEARSSSEDTKKFEWGSRDKVYRISNGLLEVMDFEPYTLKARKKEISVEEEKFSGKGQLYLGISSEDILSTGTAPFGTVLELVDRIIVLRSDGEQEDYPGEAMHWRIFPRSDNYSNQLHIIYEDRLLVISYVHDYFVDQKKKIMGTSKKSAGQSSGYFDEI